MTLSSQELRRRRDNVRYHHGLVVRVAGHYEDEPRSWGIYDIEVTARQQLVQTKLIERIQRVAQLTVIV
jgi:hypothetical protein